jgi:tRNA 2-selenouridine synthase
MIKSIPIDQFLALKKVVPIIDVRSQGEFAQGHISGAINIPILDDDARKIVGTMYKQHGRQTAVLKGLELTGPEMSSTLRKGIKVTPDGRALVHCWRGGMRSEFFAFLMHYYGFESIVLEGGYKAYRGAVHESFNKKYDIKVLTGKTGSGKTEILHALKQNGAQIIDLEGLSHHRGSSFGALGMEPQPSQEQFENRLFEELNALDASKTIWIEDESRTIGSKVIPEGLWTQMKNAPMVEVHRTDDERMAQIILDYGHFDMEVLKVAMARIGKRLGPQHVKQALIHLDQHEISEAFAIALKYYDRAYAHLLSKREKAEIQSVDGSQKEYTEIAVELNGI